MTDQLKQALPDRKIIDRDMINNVRICTRKKRLELNSANIDIDPKYFDPTYITRQKDTADKYSKDKHLLQ